MKDLDQRLLEGLREMGAAAGPPPGLYERARGRMVSYRRRARIGTALVAAATLIAAVSLLPVVNRRAGEAGAGSRGAPGVAVDPSVGHWSLLPATRLVLEKDGGALSVWTGKEMVVWAEADAAGARYDPATKRWRPLPDGPLGPRQGASAVWTGTEMLVWGGRAGDEVVRDPGAAYDPATDTWRRLPRPPVRLRAQHTAVWSGTEMLVWGGSGSLPRRPYFADGAAYDPGADRWRRLPQAPLLRRADHTAVWTGREMVVWGGSEGDSDVGFYGDGAAFDPAAQSWRPVSPSPLVARSGHAGVWSGAQMLLWGGSADDGPTADGASWDPATGAWSALPVAPLGPRVRHTAVWTGAEMLAWGGAGAGRRRFADGAAYDPARSVWRRLPAVLLAPRFDHAATWTGTAMFVWGGRAPGDPPLNDGAVFRLGPAPRSARAGTGEGSGGQGLRAQAERAAAGACREARRVAATPADAQRFVEGFLRVRTLGAGAEECLSVPALQMYLPDVLARRNPASRPPPLCLYECGRAVVVAFRRDKGWLKGSADGAYIATVKVVLEQRNGSNDVTDYVIEEVLRLGPGRTWSGRTARLVIQQVKTSLG
jgi:hypothetical protein